MTPALVDPGDPPERQAAKLTRIAEVLMDRVERATDDSGAAYAHFQRAVMLEDEVRARTRDLERTLDLLNESNARLAESMGATEAARRDLADALETIPDGFAMFDADGRLALYNSRFAATLPDVRAGLRQGLSYEAYVDLVSRSAALVRPEGETPEGWRDARMAAHYRASVNVNQKLRGDRWLQVGEHRMASGGTVVTQSEITDIIQAEREERGKLLDDQARLIRSTLEHIDQGVCIFDPKGRLSIWNGRIPALLPMPRRRLRRGLSLAAFTAELARAASLADPGSARRIRDWLAGPDRAAPLQAELVTPSRGYLDARAEAMEDGSVLLSLRDVTAERQAAQDLIEAKNGLERRVVDRTLELEDALGAAERANASKTRFLAAASHDLLQPLSAAKLYLQSMKDALAGGPSARTADKACEALTSVEEIIEALSSIARLESDEVPIRRQHFALAPLLARLRDEFAPQAELKQIALRVRGPAVWIASDAFYLRCILRNLIGNAVRYTERGKVLVAVRRRGPTFRIEVRDTGPGIPADAQERIFEAFQRLETGGPAQPGMGLGLAIVERACARLNHPLDLTSAPGRGTCFAVTVTGVAAAPRQPG